MASPVKLARVELEALGYTAVVERRGGVLRMQKPGTNQFAARAIAGGKGYHTLAGAEIDTAIQPDTGVWQHRMLNADYNIRAKSAFNGAPLVEYSDPTRTEWVTLQPRQLNWHNDRGDVQVAGGVGNVSAVVNDDTLTWTNAFGAGRHFVFNAQPTRLAKKLIVDSYASLPAPSTQVLTGGNPVLQLQFQFAWSATLTVWVDGVQWTGGGGAPTLTTGSAIEFRRPNNSVAFAFRNPFAVSADRKIQSGLMRVSRSGSNILVEIRISQAWLEAAVYPVIVDPTVDVSVAAGADDGFWRESSAEYSNTAVAGTIGNANVSGRIYNSFYRFTGITVSGTINVSYITLKANALVGSTVNTKVFADDQSAPGAITSSADGNGRTRTTAGVDWDISTFNSGTSYNSPSINTVIQELVDSYSYSGGVVQIIHDDDGSTFENYIAQYFYDNAAGDAPALHIEYTAGGGGAVGPLIGGHLVKKGILQGRLVG